MVPQILLLNVAEDVDTTGRKGNGSLQNPDLSCCSMDPEFTPRYPVMGRSGHN